MTPQPLSRATVRWAYRFVLGREPESEAVLTNWAASGDLMGLREGLLESAEFAALATEGFPERGGWIHGPVTEEALATLLSLRDAAPPTPNTIEATRPLAPDLRALRRLLLDAPELRRRAPQRPRPREGRLELAGRSLRLHDASEPPEAAPGRDIAARHAALLAACWAEGGAGRVLLDATAGSGLPALGLACGAPNHAALLAFEPELARAAALAANLAGNGFTAARVRAVALDQPKEALAREGLARLDVLRVGGTPALRHGAAWAGAALAQGALVVLELDLAALLAEGHLAPGAVLEEWCALAPHATAFTAASEPYALDSAAARGRFLLGALAPAGRSDELVLSLDSSWRARFLLGGALLP